MSCKLKVLTLSAIIFLAIPLFNNRLTLNEPSAVAYGSDPTSTRTVNYRIYSFFDVPIKEDVWAMRYEAYGEDYLLSSTYPVVYLWQPDIGWIYYYTSARVSVEGRNLPEIKIDAPEFLPYNLMGNLEPGVTGGTAQLVNWYLDYANTTRLNQINFPPGQRDGWISELKGTIIMDKNATKKILGITEAQFNNFTGWWSTNKENVITKWSTWLTTLGGPGGRLDIRPMFDYPYTDWGDRYGYYLNLETATSDNVTLSLDIISWGMECILARMFRETFMPGLEGFYDDLKFNATIGPTLSDVSLDTAWTWAMYMWSYNDTAFAPPIWCFEPILGDYPDLAESYGVTTSPAYPYHDKTYYVVAPGNDYYSDYGLYDYAPNCFNLGEGETLTVDWSNIYVKGKVWVFKQNPWTSPQHPNDTLTVYKGKLELSTLTSEPYMQWGTYPQIVYNPTAKTITFTGPINFTQLSLENIPEEWERINGLLPWGEPFLEFKVVNYDVTDDGYVGIDDIVAVAEHFGSQPGSPNWNPIYDITQDGYVGIDDVVITAEHFGQEA